MSRSTCPIATISLLAIAAACASTDGARRGADSAVITAEEVAASPVNNAYDLVQALRPRWLNERGQQRLTTTQRRDAAGRAVRGMDTSAIVAYVDGTRLGDVNALRTVNTSDIRSVRHLNSSEATLQFGSGHTHGAILVTTR